MSAISRIMFPLLWLTILEQPKIENVSPGGWVGKFTPKLLFKDLLRKNERTKRQQARKLQATLVRNYDSPTDLLTGVRCRATSVAKKLKRQKDKNTKRQRPKTNKRA